MRSIIKRGLKAQCHGIQSRQAVKEQISTRRHSLLSVRWVTDRSHVRRQTVLGPVKVHTQFCRQRDTGFTADGMNTSGTLVLLNVIDLVFSAYIVYHGYHVSMTKNCHLSFVMKKQLYIHTKYWWFHVSVICLIQDSQM